MLPYNTLEPVKHYPTYYRTHYPMLEKPGAQNVAACENHGKQHQLTDQLKSCFWKK